MVSDKEHMHICVYLCRPTTLTNALVGLLLKGQPAEVSREERNEKNGPCCGEQRRTEREERTLLW